MATVQSLVAPVALYLVEKAAQRKLVYYMEVAQAVGTHQRVIPMVLEVLRSLCIEQGWPALTSIVVSKATGRPGEAFLDPWVSRDAPEGNKVALNQEFAAAVFDFDWSPLLTRLGAQPREVAATREAPKRVPIRCEAWFEDGAVQIAFPDGMRTTVSDVRGSSAFHAALYSILSEVLRKAEGLR